jgi:hypothetical protein
MNRPVLPTESLGLWRSSFIHHESQQLVLASLVLRSLAGRGACATTPVVVSSGHGETGKTRFT